MQLERPCFWETGLLHRQHDPFKFHDQGAQSMLTADWCCPGGGAMTDGARP
jgi:hypothetical protein